jgi:hypothetical protein
MDIPFWFFLLPFGLGCLIGAAIVWATQQR